MAVDKSAARIRSMFGEIAGRYDLLNRVLSLGIDRRWRRTTVRCVAPTESGPILDVCTGTGDLALEYLRHSPPAVTVVGLDFCRPMLQLAAPKAGALASRVHWLEGDATRLPFADETFQIVSVAFGLRNVSDTDRGLAEMARVCRTGGRVAVLEFSLPTVPGVAPLYRWYFQRVLPRIGQWLARNRQSAYCYLPASVGEFPQREALARRMRAAGLGEVRFVSLTFGVATLYVGTKVSAGG